MCVYRNKEGSFLPSNHHLSFLNLFLARGSLTAMVKTESPLGVRGEWQPLGIRKGFREILYVI